MKFNKSLVAIFACYVLLLCMPHRLTETEAQEITTTTTTTGSENLISDNDAPSQDTSTIPSRSTNNFLRLLYRPIGVTLNNARQFIGNRIKAWRTFMRVYNKTYSPEELPRRMALFFRRREEIQQSVRAFMEGKSLFAMKENSFSDWDDKELRKMNGVTMPSAGQLEADEQDFGGGSVSRSIRANVWDENEEHPNITVKAGTVTPISRDWRASGCVSKPIDQLEGCGSCYAIATMSVVESMKCIRQRASAPLSPQHIVDCATAETGYDIWGCDGGWPISVLKYLRDAGVAVRDKCYPYVARKGACSLTRLSGANDCLVGASTKPGEKIQFEVLHGEQELLFHVAHTGPVVALMKVTNNFFFYNEGVFDDPRCSNEPNEADHAIVIVGYGKEYGVDYWLIKNSWGATGWGMDGFAKVRRNACSIDHWGWVVTG